jgi:RNA 3'-terminal phosphate cyclase (ATP)
MRRPNPGLRPQHLQVVEAIRQLVDGITEGVQKGTQEFVFAPGFQQKASHYAWNIGSAGSATMLALAVLPVLVFRSSPVDVTIQGDTFQDFAPSVYHLQHAVLPLLWRMGVHAVIDMQRPGYVPRGGGVLHLRVSPGREQLRPLVMQHGGAVQRLWGIALASPLAERRVSQRMAVRPDSLYGRWVCSGDRDAGRQQRSTARSRFRGLCRHGDRGASGR